MAAPPKSHNLRIFSNYSLCHHQFMHTMINSKESIHLLLVGPNKVRQESSMDWPQKSIINTLIIIKKRKENYRK